MGHYGLLSRHRSRFYVVQPSFNDSVAEYAHNWFMTTLRELMHSDLHLFYKRA